MSPEIIMPSLVQATATPTTALKSTTMSQTPDTMNSQRAGIIMIVGNQREQSSQEVAYLLQSDMNIAKKANMYFKVATPTITNIGEGEVLPRQQSKSSNRQSTQNHNTISMRKYDSVATVPVTNRRQTNQMKHLAQDIVATFKANDGTNIKKTSTEQRTKEEYQQEFQRFKHLRMKEDQQSSQSAVSRSIQQHEEERKDLGTSPIQNQSESFNDENGPPHLKLESPSVTIQTKQNFLKNDGTSSKVYRQLVTDKSRADVRSTSSVSQLIDRTHTQDGTDIE